MQRSGKISIHDVINSTALCFLTPPTTHLITTPHSPIYALNSKQQSLFLRGTPKHHFMITACSRINVRTNAVNKGFFISHPGDQDTSCSVRSEERSQSQLFVFRFAESDIFKQHVVSHPESTQQLQTLSYDTLEETCNLYLQKRLALSLYCMQTVLELHK